MAQDFRLLSVLCLVVAYLAATTTTEGLAIASGDNSTVAGNSTTTTATPTNTTVAGNITMPTATPTTTTVAGNITMPTATPTTTTVAGNITMPTATPTTTTVAGNITMPTATPTTTTVAGNITMPTATPTTTTVAGNITMPTATPTTTTVAGNITMPTATPTTTTVAGNITMPTATPTTTTVAGNITMPTATPTTTTVAGNITMPTATPTTTTVAGNITKPTVTPTTTTVAGNITKPTVTPTTTTVAGNITIATATPATTTTPTPDPCDGKPCRDGSTCEPRVNQTFTCLCVAGEYDYDRKLCERAKVFPGQLDLPSLTYNENMAVKTSPEFQEASQKITTELDSVFGESDGFSGSIVLELRKLPSPDSRVWSRAEDKVSATVEIFFNANTDISSAEVTEKIHDGGGCTGCLLESAFFSATDLCEKAPCDLTTTTCVAGNGSFTCECLKGYTETNFTDTLCVACASGEGTDETGTCVKCPFGRSGFNCNESWELILVIVGSVLGGLLLITLILLPILACRPSKKSSKKNKKSDAVKSYDSKPHAKAPLVNNGLANSQAAPVNGPAHNLAAFANAGVPRIPRATSTNSWDSRTNLEMTPSHSRQNLIPMGRNPRLYDDHEDMNPYAQTRPQGNLYAQARPQNNPYAQTRPQTNPYSQSQGQSNPYYMHDNGRRFN